MGKKEGLQGKKPDGDQPQLKKSVGPVTPLSPQDGWRVETMKKEGGKM